MSVVERILPAGGLWGWNAAGRPPERSPGRGGHETASPRVIDLATETADLGTTDGGSPVRVLLVEDDSLFANLVASILREASPNFQVEYAPRLSTALARIARDRISLILTDLQLPDSSGPTTVRFLRGAAPAVPIIVLSGIDDVDVALEAVREGADEYVVKGRFSVESLVWLVRLVLERHRRFVADPGGTPVDPETVNLFASLPALQVIGRHLLRVADRTGLHLGVVYLAVEAAPRGRWADWDRLVIWVCDVMRQTLRRCDLISRLGRGELAVLLIGEGPLVGGAERLKKAIADGGAGTHVRIGFSAYEPEHVATLDELLDAARRGAQPVLTS
jgi:two-component system cell cycle response regulator